MLIYIHMTFITVFKRKHRFFKSCTHPGLQTGVLLPLLNNSLGYGQNNLGLRLQQNKMHQYL